MLTMNSTTTMEKGSNARHISYVNATMDEIHRYNDKIQELIPELYESLMDKDDTESNKICNSLAQYQSKLKKVIDHVRADVKQ